MMRKFMLMAILTATIDPVFAQGACPNPVPEEPTRPQIVARLGEIQKLLGEIQKLKGATLTAHRVGPTGNVDPEGDQDLDFTENVPGATSTKTIEHSEQVAFCALATVRMKEVKIADALDCAVEQDRNTHKWKVTLSSYSVCRIMCLR
jgi:hypothetical protein